MTCPILSGHRQRYMCDSPPCYDPRTHGQRNRKRALGLRRATRAICGHTTRMNGLNVNDFGSMLRRVESCRCPEDVAVAEAESGGGGFMVVVLAFMEIRLTHSLTVSRGRNGRTRTTTLTLPGPGGLWGWRSKSGKISYLGRNEDPGRPKAMLLIGRASVRRSLRGLGLRLRCCMVNWCFKVIK